MPESEALHAAHRLEYPYSRSVGPVIGAFLTGLRDGKLFGVRGAGGTVIVPPTEYDPTTGEGIAVGLLLAERLAVHLDAALTGRISPGAAAVAHTSDHRRLWTDRRRLTRLALLMAGHPRVSRRAITRAATRPAALEALLGVNCGYWGFGRLSARDWLSLAGF